MLPAIFMKLGLMVPMAISIIFFHEIPTFPQILGACIAFIAILLINMEHEHTTVQFKVGLILLLLGGGCADAMSKIFDELGDNALSSQFLFYTFIVAFLLCVGLMLRQGEKIGRADVIYGALIGVPNFFSARFLLKSLASIPAVIAYPSFCVGTILLVTFAGLLFFKERLGRQQKWGIIMILIAVALLNL